MAVVFVFRCVVFVKIFVKIFDVGIILDTIFFVVVFISVVFGNVVVDDDISFVVGVVFNVAELMISVVEDGVDVFDADICFVFETSICDFDLIVVILADDANNSDDDSVDVVLDVVNDRCFDFVDAIDALVAKDDIEEDIVIVVNIDVVDFSFSTCLKKIESIKLDQIMLYTVNHHLKYEEKK